MEVQSTQQMENDRLYQQSLAHLQQGQWEQAVESILQLQQRYGAGNEVETLLQEARFKASLDQQPLAIERLSWRERWRRWRPRVLLALLALAIAVPLVAGVLYYQRTVVPARLVTQEEMRLAELRHQGEFHLAARQYAQAIQSFEALLAEIPDDETALQGIATAEERQELDALAESVAELVEAREWQAALELMDEIRAAHPDYGGLAEERALAEKQLLVQVAFDEAEAAYGEASWEQALLKYEQLRALDRSFEKAVVTERLFQTYVHRGQELVASAGGSLDLVKDAREFFAKALVLRPGESQVVTERDWAQAYIEGSQASEEEDWERAVEALSGLYIDRPDYADMVGPLLYGAYLEKGQACEAEGDVDGAMAQYQSALGIAGVDHSQAERYISILSPPPAPLPAPAAEVADDSTPTPTAQPVSDGWYDLLSMGARPNCAVTKVGGVIKDGDGLPVTGVRVGLENSSGKLRTSSPSDVDGQYQITVANEPVADTWMVYIVQGKEPLSLSYSFQTSSGCVNGLQEYRVDWQRR
jgi:tetratricopeptide (TPR) repeat protein